MLKDTNTPRVDMKTVAPELYRKMQEMSKPTDGIELDTVLRELIKVRVSQLNRCAYCLSMHVGAARKLGISDDHLHLLNAWRDASCFTEPERIALELAEAVTDISTQGVPASLYDRVRQHFSEEQYVALLATINTINAWNRFMIGLGYTPSVHS